MTRPPETEAYFAGRRLAASIHGITTAEELEERALRYAKAAGTLGQQAAIFAAFIRGFEGGKL